MTDSPEGEGRGGPSRRFFYEQGLYNFIDTTILEKYTPAGIRVISNPFNANSDNVFEGQILEKVLAANK